MIIHAQKPGTGQAICGKQWAILRKPKHATCPQCLVQPADSPLGLTEQQHADSTLNEMIETLPSPFKSLSGMYNGMTVRPAAQPVDNPVDNR